jgi:FlaA1/EpsC-like NDP-sugar epimerase
MKPQSGSKAVADPSAKLASGLLTDRLLSLPRTAKQALAVLLDIALCVLALWAAFALRLETLFPPVQTIPLAAAIGAAVAIPIFVLLGLYRAVFRYSGAQALISITKAVAAFGLLFFLVFTVVGVQGVPRSVGILQPIIFLLLVGASRWLVRLWLGGRIAQSPDKSDWPNVLIYGAGEAGRQLAAGLANARGWNLVGFLDDDRNLWGGSIDCHRVYDPATLRAVVERQSVSELWLAMPAMTAARRRELIESIRSIPVHVRSLPTITDLASGRVKLSDIQELDVNDLLGRDPVEPHGLLLNRSVRGKTVLVTGAGGSIGSELCRQIAALEPARLVLVDNSEHALYSIHREMLGTLQREQRSEDVDVDVDVDVDNAFADRLIPILASVTDENVMAKVFGHFSPQTVFHAAAYKHVPMVERNIGAAVLNNVWGTRVCAQQALASGTETFMLVSTDKAVRPTNVMGTTKRVAELIVQASAASLDRSSRSFAAVRFGNVLGSSGSVVPLFREQIAKGGPVTLTHAEVTRYFMTIPEAAQLVLQAAGMAKGGEVFVLDMGKPVRIYDLARRMIEFSGQTVRDELNPRGTLEIRVSGLRPGEKLYEELLIGGDPEATAHPKILKACETSMERDALEDRLLVLQGLIESNNSTGIRQLLAELVPEFSPANDTVDWGATAATPAPVARREFGSSLPG